jgi:hypothetical protein
MTDFAYAVDGSNVSVTSLAAGPWDPRLQHGGAPSSLAAWAAERVPTPVPMRVARVTVDLFRPVPVAELSIETSVLQRRRSYLHKSLVFGSDRLEASPICLSNPGELP